MRQIPNAFYATTGMMALPLMCTGCTLKATLNETTDTTSNITGTTSGRTWWNEDGQLNPEYKAIAFATFNQANLEQQIAQGSGEYVMSLGTLLGVAPEDQATFLGAVQADFTTLVAIDQRAQLAHFRSLTR
jgi:hypothetical protein